MRGLEFFSSSDEISLYYFSCFKSMDTDWTERSWGRGAGIKIDRKMVGERRGKFTLGSRKMNHIPILLEHVDFLNSLNRLHIELLKRRL